MTESELEQMVVEETTCVHFNGPDNRLCAIGIGYENVRKTPLISSLLKMPGTPAPSCLPCIACKNTMGAYCVKYQAPAPAEIAAKRKRALDVKKVTAAIALSAGGLRGIRGTVVCPACGGHFIYRVAAFTGHKSGACKTSGCLSFE